MHITCPHCLHKAHITSSNDLNDEKTISDLYCICLNPDCAGRFVMQLAFQRWLAPPAISIVQLAANLLNTLSKAEREALLQGLPPG
ncbi:ogr/Delta-like zinc finger family protein [Methylomonas sp. SURF-2]|uniref:Ogr/Delta-like zinc finger family protein n=1 Tax=Methylomonas subterranea TaxID=2952225 RepID=A0ABT1TJ69_9GAMM|nr:ogr/Delta-like zinc finger family protein [Methylomonas sp. SURF-2]MCQ8105516.1 ogr/Delta-like zinc finger family protein [Methylomonas sp. SURF-2]